MARRTSNSLIFESLLLEGGLFVPAILEKAARGDHTGQSVSDYRLPKGLSLTDEQGRAFRIASALWKNFEAARLRRDVPATQATTGFALEFLRDALGFAEVKPCSVPIEVGDRAFPITAFATPGRVPLVVAPHDLDLDAPDERFVVRGSGSRRLSAYQLAQQFLNASPSCTWAILTNGRQLRLVRDADTLTRPAFLEADLELILRDQRYADFAAIWRLFHSSRVGETDDTCIWESWRREGQGQGERVRDGLRKGVTDALLALGTGFLEHPANTELRQKLQSGELTKDAYFQQLLRLIYRCLFLFAVEERGLLHVADDSVEARTARDVYAQGYAFRRLRDRALRRAGFDRHGDLWTSIQIVFRGLAGGEPRLAIPALGGLFGLAQCADIDRARLENRTLLAAMRELRWSKIGGALAAIDYRNMGAEELGSVYESLLELVPTLDLSTRQFGFVGLTEAGSTAGNARKTTGSYYTPDSLVQELIKSALDPVIAARLAAQPDRPIEALLSITVCDLSCGSGHFLLAAARRLAEKLAELRAPDGAVRPEDYRHALREVASRCLYGVDINPMAVELCRVALWLETVDPGKPLGFLNHHIRTGNSLLGTTPDLIAAGLPDDTFTAIEGDDKAACTELKKRNKNEREGFGPLFQQEEQAIRARLRLAATQIEAMDDNQPAARDKKEVAFTTSETAPEYRHAKFLADLWCAAFVIKKHFPDSSAEVLVATPPAQVAPVAGQLIHSQDELFGQPAPTSATAKKKAKSAATPSFAPRPPAVGITTAHLQDFVQGRVVPADLQSEVAALARHYKFFHWHLAFPQIFEKGGFDCILGNPPWERTAFEELEFFAQRAPSVLEAGTTALRKLRIADLEFTNPDIFVEFYRAKRMAHAENHLFINSGKYRLGASGRINTYALFTDLALSLVNRFGRAGMIVQSSIATDVPMEGFWRYLVTNRRLISLLDFENRSRLFPQVHTEQKFCLLTLSGGQNPPEDMTIGFWLTDPHQIGDAEKVYKTSIDSLVAINPNTSQPPVCRSKRDFYLVHYIQKSNAIIRPESGKNPFAFAWRALMTAASSSEFRTIESLAGGDVLEDGSINFEGREYVPLVEAKLIHQYDPAYATYDSVSQESRHSGAPRETFLSERSDKMRTTPRYWGLRTLVEKMYADKNWTKEWTIGIRDVTNVNNERTAIAAALPRVGLIQPLNAVSCETSANALFLLGALNCMALDYVARQKVSGRHLNVTVFSQLPIPLLK